MKLHEIEGKWNVHKTNFPMWKSKSKFSPSITYTYVKENDCLLDEVRYENGSGKVSKISGYDYAVKSGNENVSDGLEELDSSLRMVQKKIVWKGKGVLCLLRSYWEIIAICGNVMLIRFGKTLFTPAGFDILVRDGKAKKKDLQMIEELLEVQEKESIFQTASSVVLQDD